MNWRAPVEFRWALLAVLIATLTAMITWTDMGHGLVQTRWGLFGIGYVREYSSVSVGEVGHENLCFGVGWVPAVGILLWQYIRNRKKRSD
ncbi:MAG: hypothetical protein JW753_11750 [Dehalococcoidia bacterium]|nr:hypothetical protein [Dehalococcoidia bacterium]